MEEQHPVPQSEATGSSVKKKRSLIIRRPRPGTQFIADQSPVSFTPPSDDSSKISSDENVGNANSGAKMLNLDHCVSRSLPVSGNGNGPKKFKLKVGGVTRTIQTKSSSNVGSSTSTSQVSHVASSGHKLNPQENSDNHRHQARDSRTGLYGNKDSQRGGFSQRKEDTARRNSFEQSDSVRKSKRVPKRRVLDGDSDEEEDREMRYLLKLKNSKLAGYKETETSFASTEEVGRYSGREIKKRRLEEMDYEEDEDVVMVTDNELGEKKKKQKRDQSDMQAENNQGIVLTTRQRALLTKDASSPSHIEFPNGLPPPPSKKQKEKLTEVEQQLKKAEAAERRRIQNEKAARETQEEAIRKILGQDSSRKKRDEKIKKHQEELAQEKAAKAQMLASTTIRWVMGPAGTTVIFPQDMSLPNIFDPKTCSYPPPRESCAGPSCTNPFRYRHSKLKIPLCSLQCYKAIHEKKKLEKAF